MAVKRRKDNKNRVLKEGEYQRASGTYEFKWRDKLGGRRSISAVTLEELREKEFDVLRDIVDGVRLDKNNLTINDLYNRWVQLKRGLKDSSSINYKYIYGVFVEPDFGKNRIIDLKRSDIKAFYNHLFSTKNIQIGTIAIVHNVLHQVLDLGVGDDYLRYNPSDKALTELKKTCCGGTENKRALTVPEQELFEKFLSKPGRYHRWYPVFIVMLWTGMRVGEVTGLRWCDIDLDKDIINVNHSLVHYAMKMDAGKYFTINTPKTKNGERTIPMLPIVKEAFLMEKEYQKELGVKSVSVVDGYRDFIFVDRLGNVKSRRTLNKVLQSIIKKCNSEIADTEQKDDVVLLPHFSNHSLRHTFATRMCEAGVNIKAMQQILGHTDIQTTMNIYVEATQDLQKSELNNFYTHFNRKTNCAVGLDDKTLRPMCDQFTTTYEEL